MREFHPLVLFRLKGRGRVNQANTKEMGADPKASTNEKHSGMSFLAVPNIFGGLTDMSRAKESIERMKMASGAINDAVLQAYSANTKGAADYAAKVIEFSGANSSLPARATVIDQSFSQTPEPTAIVLALFGLSAGCGFIRRRK